MYAAHNQLYVSATTLMITKEPRVDLTFRAAPASGQSRIRLAGTIPQVLMKGNMVKVLGPFHHGLRQSMQACLHLHSSSATRPAPLLVNQLSKALMSGYDRPVRDYILRS